MRFLLDTNILLWIVATPSRLDLPTRSLLQDRENEVFFSAASIWEIAIKYGLGRVNFASSPDEIVEEAIDAGFRELPVYATVATRVASLPHHHRDPFDRLLVAQAMAEPAILLTADRMLLRYSELVTLIERSPSS